MKNYLIGLSVVLMILGFLFWIEPTIEWYKMTREPTKIFWAKYWFRYVIILALIIGGRFLMLFNLDK